MVMMLEGISCGSGGGGGGSDDDQMVQRGVVVR